MNGVNGTTMTIGIHVPHTPVDSTAVAQHSPYDLPTKTQFVRHALPHTGQAHHTVGGARFNLIDVI